MTQSLRNLKGVGEKTEKLFQKVDVYTTEDLLRYYPRNYDVYEAPVKISDLEEGTVKAVSAFVSGPVSVIPARGKQAVTAIVSDDSGKIQTIWFNMPYLKSTLKKGRLFVFRGRVIKRQNRLQMEHPKVFTPAAYEEILHSLQPVYSLTAGLSNNTVIKLVKQALNECAPAEEFLPDEIRIKYHLTDIRDAIKTIHFPLDRAAMLAARKRLVFDEFLCFALAVQMLKGQVEEAPNAFPMRLTWTTEKIIEGLPYRLTNAQQKAWREIERDLAGRSLMSRLVQGDVGSGKTILAFLAMVLSAENGYQAALMAPTEVLARQHYEGFKKLKEEHGLSVNAVLLTGSCTAKERRNIYAQIASGGASVIIGTHALIQEKVEYHKLGLVITDEQHRFGVKQRKSLANRGATPNVLVMSATPIPRTLAIILYGDLDISVIDELPASRLPVKNCVVDVSWRSKAHAFIERQVREGRQAYVICPMVEESEGLEAENVLDYTKMLKKALPENITVQSLHGKMKPKEKNRIMEAFAAGEIDVLVSTTVVEVGVNVPNASVMLVENAERFGLAQLHQLRGRIGRGENQSYCIFIQGTKEETTSKRLQILNRSNDGFYIAEEDLKLRGPGDLFGIRQSGDMEFRIGDIYNDTDILKAAADAAAQILSLDPFLELERHRRLKKEMESRRRPDFEGPGV